MQALKIKNFRWVIFPLLLLNLYCLVNLATKGDYCSHFRINISDSLPFYLFTTSPLKEIKRNIYVSLSHPFSQRDLFKQVTGLPGDTISLCHQRIFINEQEIGYIYSRSPSGLPLSPIKEGVIPEGFIFVKASHPQSFDSRYAEFGLVAKEQLKEQLWPIF